MLKVYGHFLLRARVLNETLEGGWAQTGMQTDCITEIWYQVVDQAHG